MLQGYFLNYSFMMLTYINIFTAIYWDHTVPSRRHAYKFIHALVFVLTTWLVVGRKGESACSW